MSITITNVMAIDRAATASILDGSKNVGIRNTARQTHTDSATTNWVCLVINTVLKLTLA